ncbi:glyceraldehyde-3-phosphate dehydrogenase [Xylariales sp. PMI_506]|nr:glyceraldehyde-3-phosphate dehydrogenase [Xylariales sp. PMI_506]
MGSLSGFVEPEVAKVGINGFGRIGRIALRQSLSRKDIQVVAINHTCTTADDLIYLVRHDTTHGTLRDDIDIEFISEQQIRINGQPIALTSTRDLAQLDWRALGADYVLECTGKFTHSEQASRHVTEAGCRAVVISAPSPDAPTFVYGVNDGDYCKEDSFAPVLSAASCTTNCVAPILKLLNDSVGIDQAFLTTVHAATQSQHILDGYSKKNRRLGRSVFNNIIPTTTGASKAIGVVIPDMIGKIKGISIRVPTSDVSMIDLSVATQQPSSLPQILDAFRRGAEGKMKGVVHVSDQELVSSDLLGSPYSAVVDGNACLELNPKFFKIIAWYDNEWGYSGRLLDLVSVVHKNEKK